MSIDGKFCVVCPPRSIWDGAARPGRGGGGVGFGGDPKLWQQIWLVLLTRQSSLFDGWKLSATDSFPICRSNKKCEPIRRGTLWHRTATLALCKIIIPNHTRLTFLHDRTLQLMQMIPFCFDELTKTMICHHKIGSWALLRPEPVYIWYSSIALTNFPIKPT